MNENPFQIAGEAYDRAGIRPGSTTEFTSQSVAEGASADSKDYVTVCEVCDTLVNSLASPTGEITWLHAKTWQRYDHEPVPIRQSRDAPREMLCDFCGLTLPLKWAYVGDVITMRSGNTGNNYGHIWSACIACSDLIDASDLDGLVDRTVKVSVLGRTSGITPQILRDHIYKLHSQFLPTINSRQYIGPPIEPSKLNPRLMPKIQAGLRRFWTHPNLHTKLGHTDRERSLPGAFLGQPDKFRCIVALGEDVPEDAFSAHANHINVGIQAADLYWVSEDFTSLAIMAGMDLREMTLRREDLPSPFGVLVWARPIGEIERAYGTAGIRAISWTLVPGGVWINVYIQVEDADPSITELPEFRAEFGYLLSPNVGSGLPWGEMGAVDDSMRTPDNFILTMLATWLLMRQPGVAEQSIAPVDKGLARAYKRANKKLPAVRLVDLRTRPRTQHAVTGNEVSTGRKIEHRQFRKGHWKWIVFGAKRGQRRYDYISPYITGDETMPLKADVKTVKVLR